MVNLEIRNKLPSDAIVFDNQSYDNSIIGVTLDGRVIYCLEYMIDEYMQENQCEEIDAIEWIEYNTIRALVYMGEKAPLIVTNQFQGEEDAEPYSIEELLKCEVVDDGE